MNLRSVSVVCAALALLAPLGLPAATPPAGPVDAASLLRPQDFNGWDRRADRAVTRGGSVVLHWNDDLLGDLGLRRPQAAAGRDAALALGEASRFDLDAVGPMIFGLVGADAALDGSIALDGNGERILIEAPRLVLRPGKQLRIDLVGRDGQVLLYVDQIMYRFMDGGARFDVPTADLRIAPALAARIGQPNSAGLAIADLRLDSPVVARVAGNAPNVCGNPNWPGESAPGGGQYQVDVFMQSFFGQYSRCRQAAGGGTCDGPGGATDGEVVFTPSSTLINNVANGSVVATIPGDPLGTSSAIHTADVEWETKFNDQVPNGPYAAFDQHPYLIWNVYRVDADGGISQVGRSGVKHAFLTTNVGCAPGENCSPYILGRQCGDTYSTSNNDSNGSLGPRRELIPAAGQWGRCGSIYDLNCDGAANASGNGVYDQRLIVRESAIDPAANPGATFLFESWYLVRDDINIYNTMASLNFTPAWNGTSWASSNTSGPFRLGPSVDRWIDAGVLAGDITRNVELVAPEGRAKVAVRVDDLGNGSWRYHYALMNFDFARAVTEGAEPNLRVVRNDGFNRFRISIADPTALVSQLNYVDGDPQRADWTATVSADAVEWVAPAASDSQNWGVLARFSLVADKAPFNGAVTLGVTEAGSPDSYEVNSFAIGEAPLTPGDSLFANGFEEPVDP